MIKLNSKYEVLTNTDFKKFVGIKRSYAEEVFEIKLKNGHFIKSTKDHVYPTKNDGLLSSSELYVGCFLQTKNGYHQIESINKLKHNDYVYDLLEVDGGNLYYANGILTHNCAFNGSGDNVIDSKYIEYQRKNNVIDPIRTEWLDGNMWIWEDPQLGHEYILSADAASGSADDYASICIYDFTTGNQVAEYHGKIAPDTLGEIAVEYGNRYEAFTVVDTTGGYGVSTVLKMIELGYSPKKMYYDTVLGIDSVTNNKNLEKHMRDGKLPGLNFQKNRNTIVTKLEESVRMNSFKVRSIRSVTEMDTFVFKNGRPDHMKNYHDDCLMAIAMCCYVAQTSFKDFEKSKGQAKAMLDSWIVSSNEVNTIPEVVYNSPAYKDTSRHVQAPISEHNWVFFGMSGFKDSTKNKSILGS